MEEFMKKKLFIVVAIALCVVIGVCSFAGCSKPTGVDEFNEFKQKIVTVLKDNGINIVDTDVNQTAEPANTVVSLAKYVSTNDVAKIKEIILEDSEYVSDAKRVEDGRQEMYEQALFLPLVIGDGLVNNHDADTIYNTSVLIDCWYKSYMEFKTSGTLTTIYCYTPTAEKAEEYSAVCYLDYKSENDYNFVMLSVDEDGRSCYTYGNEKKQFIHIEYKPQDKFNGVYVSSEVGDGYISYNEQIVGKCFEVVKSQFEGMSAKDYEYLSEQKYTIDETEWLSLCAKYFPNVEE